ncbi:MAG: flagellar basal body P-ring formation chaperone FlgA [Thiobacillus sp.]
MNRLHVSCLMATALLASHAFAANQSPAQIQAAAERYLLTQAGSHGGQVSVEVKSPRATLPACAAMEAFSMPGSRPVGKLTVGVRCLAPSTWTVYLAAQVKAVGPYVATARALPANHVLTEADLLLREGDLGQLPADVASQPAALAGYRTVSGVAAGAALRTGLLRPPQVVQQGQPTRIVLVGPGFLVQSEGQALANAGRGDRVRVKTASGQVISGIARDGQQVEVVF